MFHTSLSVSDLNRSIAFYRALPGMEPAKQRPDFAKFELAEPALVLSLIPSPVALGGTLNHAGFRLANLFFRRGERVRLSIHDWQAISSGPAAAQFALFPPEEIA